MAGNTKKGICLDYASSTPVSSGVMSKMMPYFSTHFGNSESVHSFGREVDSAVMEAREVVAHALGRSLASGFREVIFTSSATEANNLVLRGVIGSSTSSRKLNLHPNIVISSIEHSSVYMTSVALQEEGIEVRVAHPDRNGIVSAESVKKLLDENTILVSVMHGNNEIGTIQPIEKIGSMIKEERLKSCLRRQAKEKTYPLFHTDAAQSFMYLGLHPEECGVDFATLSGHKMHGPKGVAVLFVREGLKLNPQITGGVQERGLRAGTLNVSAIVGFAEAIKESEERRKIKVKRVSELKKYFCGEIKKNIKIAEVNGDMKNSLPHILNIYFSGVRAEELVIALDMHGVAVSSGSACASRAESASRTVREVYQSEERAMSSVRFSFSENTSKKELDQTILSLRSIIHGLSTKPR